MISNSHLEVRWIWMPILLAGIGGCGQSDIPPPLRAQYTSMKPLGVLYGKFLERSRGQPPEDAASFRKFLADYGSDGLRVLGVTDIDALFVSPRTGEPLVILYGTLGPPGPAGQPYVAYEAEPLDGIRYVASAVGAVAEMDAERFARLFPDAS